MLVPLLHRDMMLWEERLAEEERAVQGMTEGGESEAGQKQLLCW